MKELLVACVLATFTVAMSRQLEPAEWDHLLAKSPENLTKECSNIVLEMMDCASFMSGGKASKPTPECCKGLKAVLDANEKCVCFALETAPSMGIAINMSRAEVMPSLCKVEAPPISSCNISDSSSPSPPAPEPSPPTPPVPSPSPVTPAPAPVPVKPSPPTKPPAPPSDAPAPPPSSPSLPPSSPATPPSSPSTPPSSPATPPSSPSTPPSPPTTPPSSPDSPVSPTPPASGPTPAAPLVPTPSTEAPAQSPESASGTMHIQMPFLVSFAVIIVSLFLV